MPDSSHPFRPFWPPLVCALLSGALWIWSKQLPISNWEKSGTPSPAPAGLPVPETASATAQANPGEPVPVVSVSPTPAAAGPAASPGDPAFTAQATPSASPSATPTPAPAPTDAELAGPLPEHTKEELAVKASATPVRALEIGEIARDPSLWPKQVVLMAPVQFSVVVKGVIAGNVLIPAGRAVNLRTVSADGTVILELPQPPGIQAKTKAQATDLYARARILADAKKPTKP